MLAVQVTDEQLIVQQLGLQYRKLCWSACREVWLDGLRHGVAVGHSLGLCFMFGPLGMLSHMITRRASKRMSESNSASNGRLSA